MLLPLSFWPDLWVPLACGFFSLLATAGTSKPPLVALGTIPSSVIIPVMRSEGVTSKDGFQTCIEMRTLLANFDIVPRVQSNASRLLPAWLNTLISPVLCTNGRIGRNMHIYMQTDHLYLLHSSMLTTDVSWLTSIPGAAVCLPPW